MITIGMYKAVFFVKYEWSIAILITHKYIRYK